MTVIIIEIDITIQATHPHFLPSHQTATQAPTESIQSPKAKAQAQNPTQHFANMVFNAVFSADVMVSLYVYLTLIQAFAYVQ